MKYTVLLSYALLLNLQ